ncbi:carbohydrate ABC transporter permease [Limobrevibacterium gyesilva]|uniref:Carbohydrate ABC transporter permease n=1 Tax=Limobrevibacterium gyesilva TaxID=2991712 RepID=A0AA42CCK1_9PROT|nr:carbohydrate ABC transporter permease [Limobrevibacterium gyesilva]MCW3473493.1 carbohydrate ABC transporter permease [Limobrevibacterium gyesilva]
MVERGERAKHGLIQLLLAINAVVMLYPLVVMVLSAFKSNAELFASPFALPESFAFTNAARVWNETSFVRYLLNSTLVTAAAIAGILVFGTMAAYAIARYPFPGRSAVFLFFLSGLMVPLKLAIIPLFIQLGAMGLIDTRAGLVLVYIAMGLPSAVFIMTGFLRTLPGELEESARIEGASEARVMLSIMLPLARPALVITGIQNAVPIWNDFFFPLVFITTDALKTLPQGLTVFMGEYNTDWGVLFAGLTLAALPITLVYIVLSRQFIAGMTQGAIK